MVLTPELLVRKLLFVVLSNEVPTEGRSRRKSETFRSPEDSIAWLLTTVIGTMDFSSGVAIRLPVTMTVSTGPAAEFAAGASSARARDGPVRHAAMRDGQRAKRAARGQPVCNSMKQPPCRSERAS